MSYTKLGRKDVSPGQMSREYGTSIRLKSRLVFVSCLLLPALRCWRSVLKLFYWLTQSPWFATSRSHWGKPDWQSCHWVVLILSTQQLGSNLRSKTPTHQSFREFQQQKDHQLLRWKSQGSSCHRCSMSHFTVTIWRWKDQLGPVFQIITTAMRQLLWNRRLWCRRTWSPGVLSETKLNRILCCWRNHQTHCRYVAAWLSDFRFYWGCGCSREQRSTSWTKCKHPH